MQKIPLIIVGAGLTGLSCARQFPADRVRVIEKSRGPGGRLSSKRIDQARADLGAQFFTVRDPRFQTEVEGMQAAGVVAPWRPRMGYFSAGCVTVSPDREPRYVGTPYMNAMGRYLSQGVSIDAERRIERVVPMTSGYELVDTDGESLFADKVLVTAPVNQMVDLLPTFDTRAIVERFPMDPTWTLIIESDSALKSADGELLDACFGGDHPVIEFIACEQSKPGRVDPFVVVHSTPEYARTMLEEAPERIAAEMSAVLRDSFGLEGAVRACHRWRYARPVDPRTVAQKGIFQVDSGLWIAGDYLAGGRVEGAYLAGLEAAARLTATNQI